LLKKITKSMIESGKKDGAVKPPFPKTISELIRQMKGDGAAAHPLVQFVKYGIVGGAATAVDIFVTFLAAIFIFQAIGAGDPLVKLFAFVGVEVPIAEISDTLRANRQIANNLIAFAFSNTFCYILNVLWVFQSGKHKRSVEFALFFAASALSTGCAILIADLFVRFAGMQTSYSVIIKIIASVMINYAARKKIVFKG